MGNSPPKAPYGRIRLVVIGVSAGGPKELQKILPLFPTGFPPPIIVVQHIAGEVLDSLVHTLNQGCYLPVRTISHGQLLEKGGIFLCPPFHQCRVVIEDGMLFARLDPDLTSAYQPCIDVTMSSAADVCGPEVVGVLLTGMGSDGVQGLRAIRAAGGVTIVESQATATVFGMPRAAMLAGVAQRILPLHQIPTELLMLVQKTDSARCLEPSTALESDDPTSRCAAIEELAACPDSTSIRLIARALKDPEAIVMETARTTLLSLPGILVFPAVIPLLESESPAVRTTAMEIAKRTGLPPEGKDILARLCTGDDSDLRLFALDIIGAYGPEDFLDLVLDRLSDPNPNVSLKAIEVLGGFHSERAVEALSVETTGESWRRAAAVEALARSPLDRAGSVLTELRFDDFEDLFMWFQALAVRKDRRSIPKLLGILPALDKRLLPHALEALEETCREHRDALSPEETAALARLPLAEFLDHPNHKAALSVIRLIGLVGGEDQLPLLVERFRRVDSAEERAMIVEAIASMRLEKSGEILEMISTGQDADPELRAFDDPGDH
ncbi:MAG: HEAT repeat domain-containing protein [Proteobacteria bacterium]|nr:HEAT repeat domain-containing protein [Pseudomonadota bacterium]